MSAPHSDPMLSPREVAHRQLVHAQRRFRRDLTENFRKFLAPTVTSASPLLLDACSAWAVDLNAALHRLRPPAGWPYDLSQKGVGGRRYPRPPRVVCKAAVGRTVQVVVMDAALEARIWLGDALACTGGGRLSLWLTRRVPETVVVGMMGRELATVVDHPVLRLRPYRVIGGGSIGHGTVVEAEAPAVRYRLPWS